MFQYMHLHKVNLSLTLIIVGALVVGISGGAIMADEEGSGVFSTLKTSSGMWIYWIIMGATVCLLLGAFYFFDFVSKRREFYKLFEEKSKSKFIKNLDRIEELAWRLHPKFEEMVIDKKKKLKIR